MIRSIDKIIIHEMVVLIGAKLTRDKILEKITLLSLPDAPKYGSVFDKITRYGGMLSYIFDNYTKELKED